MVKSYESFAAEVRGKDVKANVNARI